MRENFEKGFELLSDIYCNALFPEDEMEKERTVILSEIRRYEDDPPVYLSDLALEHYCENGLGHRVTGTVESVGQLTRSQLVAFKQNFYGGKNVMISVAGDISFETVRGVVEKHFHSPARSHPVTHVPGDYRSGNFDLTRPDIQESQYQLYFPALPFRHPRAIDQAVMAYVLGGNSSSLLFERIREELGLCYGIYARVNHFEGFNYLDVSTGCAEKDLEKLDREVMRIIERLTETNIEPERLEMTKTAMLSTLYMATESSSGLNTFLSMAVMRGEREENILEKRADQIKAVTAESIRESARETFSRPSLRARLTPT
jgi:predicted Zn-dependent peptidase